MNKKYLSKCAPISEASEWMQSRTGEVWPLGRLLENGLMPWFWFDYSDGWPDALFNGRTEGYLAPMCYAGDIQRLAAAGHDVLVTMTRTQGGIHMMMLSPPWHFPIDELRFRREDLERLASKGAKSGYRDADPASWKAIARHIGEEWMRQQEIKTGIIPSVKEIGTYVEGELSTRGITATRGKFPDEQTIIREALTGITGRKKGQNLRR